MSRYVKWNYSPKEYIDRCRVWVMLHDELLFFTTEIENKKVIFQQDNALIHTAVKLQKSDSMISE